MRTKKILSNTVFYAILTLLTMFFIFPIVYMIGVSLMNPDEAWTTKALFTDSFYFQSYSVMLESNYIGYLKNTVVVVIVNMIGTPLSALICAYGFARMKFRGRNFMFLVVISTMMLPSIVIMVPLYILYSKMGWLNTLFPLTIPGLFGGGAINIFLIHQYMKGIPLEIDNAAKIEGANSLQILIYIVAPLCRAVVVLTMVNTIISCWSDFTGPLMYLNSEDSYTLAIGIYYELFGNSTNVVTPNVQMAAGVSMMILPAILFFFFQNILIDGVAISGLKG